MESPSNALLGGGLIRCMRLVAVIGSLATLSLISQSAIADESKRGSGHHWVATWATSPATFLAYTPPVPPVFPP